MHSIVFMITVFFLYEKGQQKTKEQSHNTNTNNTNAHLQNLNG